MNNLSGQIEQISTEGNLSLVQVNCEGTMLSAIVIETPKTAPYLRVGNHVNLVFKETEVVLGKGLHHQVSMQNKLPGKVVSVESGKLLSRLVLDTTAGQIISVITTNAVSNLSLKKGSEVMAMIKTNEIMLSS